MSFTFHWQVQDLKLIDGFTDKIVTTFLKVSSVSRLQSLDSQFVNFIYEEMLNRNRVKENSFLTL